MPHFECGAIDHSATSPGAYLVHLAEKGNSVLARRAWCRKKAVGRLRQPAGVYAARSARHGSLVEAEPPFGAARVAPNLGGIPPNRRVNPGAAPLTGFSHSRQWGPGRDDPAEPAVYCPRDIAVALAILRSPLLFLRLMPNHHPAIRRYRDPVYGAVDSREPVDR